MLMNLVKEYGLVADVTLVKSDDNKSDQLTRVPQWWLNRVKTEVEPIQHTSAASEQIAHIHPQSTPQNKTHVFC